MVTGIHPSGRVQVQPLPNALPGKCSLCGASDNVDGREYIDIGFELDFYGVIYFCTHCMSEIAAAIGYIGPENYADLGKENTSLLSELSGLSAENVKLRVALNSLDFLGSHGALVDDVADTKESIEAKRRDNTKSAKQINEPGRTNVSKATKSNSLSLDDFAD